MNKERLQDQGKEQEVTSPILFFFYTKNSDRKIEIGTKLFPGSDYLTATPALVVDVTEPSRFSTQARFFWRLFKITDEIVVPDNLRQRLLFELQSNHILGPGTNILYPNAAVDIQKIPAGKYSFQWEIKYFPNEETVVEISEDGVVTDFRNIGKLAQTLKSIGGLNSLIGA